MPRTAWLTQLENTDRLERAEAYVRKCLRLMGQERDASNPRKVRRVALRVLERMPRPKQ